MEYKVLEVTGKHSNVPAANLDPATLINPHQWVLDYLSAVTAVRGEPTPFKIVLYIADRQEDF